MKANKSKIITAELTLENIKNDPFFVSVPSEISNVSDIKETVLNKFQSSIGILESFIDGNKIVLQWYPKNCIQEADLLYHEAAKLILKKKYDKAIENLKKAISMNREEVVYLYKLSLILYEMKKYQDAIKYLRDAVKICPVYFKAHLLLGINLIKIRKFDQAEFHILHSKRLNNENALTYLNLGAIYSIQKKFNEAIDMFKKTIQISQKESRAYLGLAKIYNMLNDVEASNKYFNKVIEISPGTQIAQYAKRSIKVNYENNSTVNVVKNNGQQLSKGLESYLMGNYSMASNAYKEYLNINPSDDYAWYLFGETKLRTGNIKESADCFRRAIKLNTKKSLYYKSLCIALHYLDNTKETIVNIKKAIELGKTDSLCYTILGINLMKQKKYDDAMRSLNNAIKKYPKNSLALYYLALIQLKKEDKNNAIKNIKKILSTELYVPIKNKAKKLNKNI